MPTLFRMDRDWFRGVGAILLLSTLVLLGGCEGSPEASTSSDRSTTAAKAGQDWQILPTGLGPVKFGMTIEEVRAVLPKGTYITPESNVMVDWDGLRVEKDGATLFYILYPQGYAPTDQDQVDLIRVDNPRYNTPEGIGPGSSINDGEAAYGTATLSYNTDNEMREYVNFANAPKHLSFRTTGTPDQFVGRYAGSSDGSYFETQNFDPLGRIQYILVDGFAAETSRSDSTEAGRTGETRAGSPVLPTEESVSTVDCSDPVTTLEINACSTQAYEESDRALNEAYDELRQEISAEDAAQLAEVQEAWLRFRDSHCNQYSQGVVGGTAYPSFLTGCLTQLTETRTGYLRQELGIFPKVYDRSYPDIGEVTVEGQTINCNAPDATVVANYCAQASYEESDRQLNELYQTLSSRLTENRKADLTTAELEWLEYRDRHCEFATREAQGGTGYNGYYANCLEDLTLDRSEQLKLQLDQ